MLVLGGVSLNHTPLVFYSPAPDWPSNCQTFSDARHSPGSGATTGCRKEAMKKTKEEAREADEEEDEEEEEQQQQLQQQQQQQQNHILYNIIKMKNYHNRN